MAEPLLNMEKSVLIIYTGGTIGMKTNPETGSLAPFNFGQIETEVPELKKLGIKVDTYTFDPVIDSSNVSPEQWVLLARIVKERYHAYDGFVVLHGTDTMSYTASAFSFMMQNLDKPVIFTGSQIPIGILRTDGKENLITAIEIAAARRDGKAIVPEVCIYFENKLFRANRTSKANADHFNAFRSYNYPPLAEAGIDIHYNDSFIRKVDAFLPSFDIVERLCCDVQIIRFFPGLSESMLHAMLHVPGLKGVVLETYGSGNAPSREWFINLIREGIAMGKIILNVTQCLAGSVDMDLYATGKKLKKAGVLDGYDCTTESALAKLFFLMGTSTDNGFVRRELDKNLRGEITK